MATSPTGKGSQNIITSVAKANGGNEDSESVKRMSQRQSGMSSDNKKRSSIRNSLRDSMRSVGTRFNNLLAPTSAKATEMAREHSLKSETEDIMMRRKQKKSLFSCFAAPLPIPSIGAQLEQDILALQKEKRDFIPKKPILPPQAPEDAGKITLLLDLDETLVHSTFEPVDNADYAIPLDLGDGTTSTVLVRKRPFVDFFLREVGKHFEVVIFTASLSLYANPLLDKLDKTKVIRHRLYREHCVYVGGSYVKDMSLLGRDMKKVILVDNSPYTYAFQPENALPCTSWIDDQTDEELNYILQILEDVKGVNDVRNCRV
ncbi:Carboxy-terminal domain RNA polymerase II polypeptide A small phosphatase 2 [Porphyridium purpureum]|uniref:Carboxy-terminal domain RNA polymerase II polypeptide A small phosphatase 2 n=1 Tax=Porphyridium purpureum TaxID=35688 RepID=A0A5J4Z9Y6_PORPP|nr:Carboxy-terminal domain RNA polymerase II polypeptide A small phosphatase 2 [Porphyridium purpureum]|eukprot:POR7790..scf295_1